MLLSDGKTTDGADPVAVAREAKRQGVPVNTVALGTEEGTVELGPFQPRIAVPPDPETMRAGSPGSPAAAPTGSRTPAGWTGSTLGQVGTFGAGPGQIYRATGVAFDPTGQFMYVAEVGNDRVQRFRLSDGALDTAWRPSGSVGGQFEDPVGAAVDDGGRIYVVEDGAAASHPSPRVQRFSPAGEPETSWSVGVGTYVAGIAVHTDPATGAVAVYVGGSRNEEVIQRVEKYNGATGEFLLMWGWGVRDGANEFQVCTAADAATSPCKEGKPGIGWPRTQPRDRRRLPRWRGDGAALRRRWQALLG